MEIKELLKNYKVIGVIGNYQSTLKLNGKVRDILVKDINKALKMVNLEEKYADFLLKDLSISELWKVDLISKLDNEIIIIGNLSNSLIYKDLELMKKLFIKLSNEYNKQIVVIDNNLNSFFNLTNKIFVLDNKKIVYNTLDFFDNKLYEYVNIPKIVDFINYVNDKGININKTVDIYELIKDIYRSVS